MQEVSKVHFLIHPGFITDPDSEHLASAQLDQQHHDWETPITRDELRAKYIQEVKLDDDWKRRKDEQEKNWLELLDKYLEKARTLTHDQLMFIFLHGRQEDFEIDKELGKKYPGKIEALTTILRKRVIVISGDWGIFDDDCDMYDDLLPGVEETAEEMRRLAQANGFTYSSDVPSEAFGEIIQACVRCGANALNRANGFSKKTRIQTKLTDIFRQSDTRIKELIGIFTKDTPYKRIVFD